MKIYCLLLITSHRDINVLYLLTRTLDQFDALQNEPARLEDLAGHVTALLLVKIEPTMSQA